MIYSESGLLNDISAFLDQRRAELDAHLVECGQEAGSEEQAIDLIERLIDELREREFAEESFDGEVDLGALAVRQQLADELDVF